MQQLCRIQMKYLIMALFQMEQADNLNYLFNVQTHTHTSRQYFFLLVNFVNFEFYNCNFPGCFSGNVCVCFVCFVHLGTIKKFKIGNGFDWIFE